MTPDEIKEARKLLASEGGKARAKKLSKKRLSEIAALGQAAMRRNKKGV